MLNCWYMIVVAFSVYHVSNAGKLTRQCKALNGRCGINKKSSCDEMFGPGWVEIGKCCNARPCCNIFRCEDIQQIPNGVVTKTGTTIGSTATFSCDTGYVLHGTPTITCAGGGWNEHLPICHGCPDIITHFSGSTYIISCNTIDLWSNAEAYCVDHGGHLASIETEKENNYLKHVAKLLRGSAWIGLSDITTEGSFQWTSGQQLTFTDWYQGPPNQPDGKTENLSPNADCVLLHQSYSWQWTDGSCVNAHTRAICEIWSVFIISLK